MDYTNEKAADATNANGHHTDTNTGNFPAELHDGQGLPLVAPKPDKDAIMAALEVLFRPEDVVELRALVKGGKKRTDAGYFDSKHWSNLANEAVRLSNSGAAVYVTLNPVDPQLLGRYNNRIESYASSTTGDKQVGRRRWLLVDGDPVRPAGTSSTEQQLKCAKLKIKEVQNYLTQVGWPLPVVAKSGNGYHLLYAIDLPNDDESTALVKGVLIALADRFDDPQTKVDRSVYNAARICKLYGTVANKGDHMRANPWRLSKLIQVPERIEVSADQLRQVASMVIESPRVLRRLQHLRRWSHEKVNEVFPRSPRTCSAHGAGAPWRISLPVGCH